MTSSRACIACPANEAFLNPIYRRARASRSRRVGRSIIPMQMTFSTGAAIHYNMKNNNMFENKCPQRSTPSSKNKWAIHSSSAPLWTDYKSKCYFMKVWNKCKIGKLTLLSFLFLYFHVGSFHKSPKVICYFKNIAPWRVHRYQLHEWGGRHSSEQPGAGGKMLK